MPSRGVTLKENEIRSKRGNLLEKCLELMQRAIKVYKSKYSLVKLDSTFPKVGV